MSNPNRNAVAPGFIREAAGAPRAIGAAAVSFVASPALWYITGQALYVDGGLVR